MDRNLVGCIDRTINIVSLSARRAWIEMYSINEVWANFSGSLSARRAWIEISMSL